MIEFFHSPSTFPKVEKAVKSSCGICLSYFFIICCIFIIILRIILYKKSFTVTFSKEWIKSKDINEEITFGFKIGDNWRKEIDIKIYDWNNNIFNDSSKIKYCDENLAEIKNKNEFNENNYTCFIGYKINTSKSTNHFIKLHLIYKGNSYHNNSDRVPLLIKFNEPIIKHEEANPFIYGETKELTFFYELNYTTRYRKFLRFISYITYQLNPYIPKNISSYYLEDFDDLSMSSQSNKYNYDGKYIGSFRISLSKKKDIIKRNYNNIIDFISSIGNNIVFVKTIMEIFGKFCINPNDNKRICNNFIRKYPSMEKIINEFSEKNENIKKKCVNLKYFKDEDKIDKENSNKLMEEINIENFLKYHIIQKKKFEKIREIINNYQKSNDNKNQNIEDILKMKYNEIEKEEYNIIIKLISDENKGNKINNNIEKKSINNSYNDINNLTLSENET